MDTAFRAVLWDVEQLGGAMLQCSNFKRKLPSFQATDKDLPAELVLKQG